MLKEGSKSGMCYAHVHVKVKGGGGKKCYAHVKVKGRVKSGMCHMHMQRLIVPHARKNGYPLVMPLGTWAWMA